MGASPRNDLKLIINVDIPGMVVEATAISFPGYTVTSFSFQDDQDIFDHAIEDNDTFYLGPGSEYSFYLHDYESDEDEGDVTLE